MILKIKENYLLLDLPAGWNIFSGIASITYTNVMTDITSVEAVGEHIKRIEEDYKPSCRPRYFRPNKKMEESKWIRITVRFVGGRREEWIVQAETYLLNDEGKTIERVF